MEFIKNQCLRNFTSAEEFNLAFNNAYLISYQKQYNSQDILSQDQIKHLVYILGQHKQIISDQCSTDLFSLELSHDDIDWQKQFNQELDKSTKLQSLLDQYENEVKEYEILSQDTYNRYSLSIKQIISAYDIQQKQVQSYAAQIEKQNKILKNQQDVIKQKTQQVLKLEKVVSDHAKIVILKQQERDLLTKNNNEKFLHLTKEINIHKEQTNDALEKQKYYENQYLSLNSQYQSFYKNYSVLNGICAELQFQLKVENYDQILNKFFFLIENSADKSIINDLQLKLDTYLILIKHLIDFIESMNKNMSQQKLKIKPLQFLGDLLNDILLKLNLLEEEIKRLQLKHQNIQDQLSDQMSQTVISFQKIKLENEQLENKIDFLQLLKSQKLPALVNIIKIQQQELQISKQEFIDLYKQFDVLDNKIQKTNSSQIKESKYLKILKTQTIITK
uniref:Uncharacterized protein n=1 Tax=Spironucleus salmonicida TaxID=348837 RepID=V6LKX8_9EUKA|eukprot:EST45207.1 Hypothetical protein SS50377_14779 [Spironucleus salmonicida]